MYKIEEISDLNVLKDKYVTFQVFLRNNGDYGVLLNDFSIIYFDQEKANEED